MYLPYNLYSWVYLAGAAMTLCTARLVYFRKRDYLFIVHLSMVACWCLGYALQISATDLDSAVFWYFTTDITVPFTASSWFLMALKITGREHWIILNRSVLLCMIPLLTGVLDLTNPWHRLMYDNFEMNKSGLYPMLDISPGPLFWIISSVCWGIVVVAIVLQGVAAFKREVLYRGMGFTIAAGTGVIVAVSLSFIFIPELFDHYDPTPISVSLFATLSNFFFRYRPQEPVPIPRSVVMEKMSSAVLILDLRNRIMDLNPAAEEVFGLRIDAIVGQNIDEVLTGWQELAAACRDKSVQHREFARDGRFYDAYFSILNDKRGKRAGRLMVLQDITASKKVEMKLLQQQQAMLVLQERERLGRELHDSQGQIMGYVNIQLQALRDQLAAGRNATVDTGLANLSQIVERANAEIREFIYEIKSPLLFKDGFFPALEKYLERFSAASKISVTVQNPDGLIGDDLPFPTQTQLFRIIQEALANVRKHSRASRGEIVFKRTDGHIHITVTDNGAGFDPAKFAGRKHFGQAIMKERAAQVGGTVQVKSAPGKGAVVIIDLPLVNDQHASLSSPVTTCAASTITESVRLLLVDDHALFLDGLRNLLSSNGFNVVAAARNGWEAIEKARVFRPDVILMDIQMPECDGLMATRLLKAELPDTKIIILSMSDRGEDLYEAMRSGASGYLLKGLRAEELLEQLSGLIHGETAIPAELAVQVIDEFGATSEANPTDGGADNAEPFPGLTPRQSEVLRLAAQGWTYRKIAQQLCISERTVKYHMGEVLERLHLRNRAEVVAYAQRVESELKNKATFK